LSGSWQYFRDHSVSFGCKPKDTEWSRKYWQLRDDINYLLSQKASFKP